MQLIPWCLQCFIETLVLPFVGKLHHYYKLEAVLS